MADEELGRAIITFGVDDSEVDRGLASSEGKAKNWAQSLADGLTSAITTAVTGAVVAGTAALAGLGTAGINAFMGFERQMNEVFTLLPGISEQAMGAMSSQVKDFAADFGALPEQVIPALYEALSSGIPPGNVFDFLGTAQKAAIGGVTDVKTTVDGLTSVVNAYGANVISTSSASDIMFKAVAYGKTTFGELSNSLYNVNPIAAALGVKFTDVAGALAAMTLQGVPTSVATTQLRQLMVELSQAGTDVSDLFIRLSGQTFKEFVASGGDVQGALQLLEQAAASGGLGINDLFGSVEAGSAALALTGQGTENFTAALDAVTNSAGATEAAFQRMDQGLGRSVDYIKSAFAILLTDVGQTLAPTFQMFADWIQGNMPQISSVVVGVFQGIANAIQAVVPYFQTFASVASDAFGIFIELASSAVTWGANIANQLANGIMAGSSAIMDSLGYIGDLIAYWLEPHSPPKLLPNIDKWGRDTAQVWMDGWNDAELPTGGLLGYLEGQLKDIEDAQQRVREQQEEAKLLDIINSTGGDDSVREQAKLELLALKMRQKIREEEAKIAAEEAANPTKAPPTTPKTSGGGGGGGKSPMDELARKAEAAARAQWEYNYSVAGTTERLQMLKDKQAEYTTADAEYWRLQGQINQEEQKHQAELDKSAKSQRDYELSLMATEEKLASLKEEQSKYAVGSKEYNNLQAEINKTEQQRGRELAELQKTKDEAARAERDYGFATADTAGKLGILRGELANTSADSADYWRIKTQISALEVQQQKELEATAAKLKGVGSATGGATKKFGGLSAGMGSLAGVLDANKAKTDATTTATDDAGTAASAAAERYADLKTAQVEAADAGNKQFSPMMTLVNHILYFLRTHIDEAKAAFSAMAIALVGVGVILPGIGFALGAILSPLGLLVLAAGAIGVAWQTNFGNIQGVVQSVVTEIGGFIQTVVAGFSEGGLLGALTAFTTGLATLRENLFSWITTNLPQWLATLGGYAAQAGQWLLDAVPVVLSSLATLLQSVIGTTFTYLPQWAGVLLEFGLKAVAWVVDALPSLVGNLGAFLNTMINWVVDSLPGWATELAKLGVQAWQWVVDMLPTLMGKLGETAGALFNWILQTAIDVVPKLLVLAGKFIAWVVTDVLPKLPETLDTIKAAMFSFVEGMVTSIVPKLTELAVKFYQWITDEVLPKVPPELALVWDAISTWISDTAGKAWEAAKLIGSNIADGISGAISSGINGLRTLVAAVINPIITGINMVIDGLNLVNPGEDIGRLNYMAKGGITRGGLTVMGEEGLERVQGRGIDVLAGAGLYDVPAGLRVTPADETAAMFAGSVRGAAAGGGGGDIYNIFVDARGNNDPAATEQAGYRGSAAAVRALTDKANIQLQKKGR
jgi:TP901 family phage tail tape measure protein